MPRSSSETWTTRRLLGWMTERFAARDLDASRVVAEMLLAHVLGCDRMRLYMEADRPASPDELDALRELVRRTVDHEPVHYLVGRASFYGREFLVDESTLIPQPATEDLVSAVIDWLDPDRGAAMPDAADVVDLADPGDLPETAEPEPPPIEAVPSPLRIADVGTGTGCIAISLALRFTHARIVATDVVPEALDLARRNAERFGVADAIEFVHGPLLEPLRAAGDAFDVVCANLPYVPDHEWDGDAVQRGVREHVPASALRGGVDGLDLIRPAIAGVTSVLAPGGLLALEIADCQHETAAALAATTDDLHRTRILKDYEGLWRVLLAERKGDRSIWPPDGNGAAGVAEAAK